MMRKQEQVVEAERLTEASILLIDMWVKRHPFNPFVRAIRESKGQEWVRETIKSQSKFGASI